MKIEARVSTKGQLTKPFVFLAKELGFEPMSQWKAFRNNTDIRFRWTECWTDTHTQRRKPFRIPYESSARHFTKFTEESVKLII